MSLTGTSINASDAELVELAHCIRMVLRDIPSNNILLDAVQFTDDDIKRAIHLTVSEFNAMPVRTSVSWRHLPEALLFMGAARWLMLSESFLQIRNQVSVPMDGVGTIGIDDKYQLYHNQVQDLKRDFMALSREIKNEMNISSGFGSMSSGYSNVSRFHHN